MAYIEHTKRCSECLQPWNGWGLVCNQCKQLDAIRSLRTTSNESSSSPTLTEDQENILLAIFFILFLLFNYFTGWFFIKFAWILLKFGFWLMFGWWMGIDIHSL